MSTPFYFDVYNNTDRTIRFMIPANTFLGGAQADYTIKGNTWMSTQHGTTPLRIANPIKTTDPDYTAYIFPLLYMNQLYSGAPLAVLMLVEAANASPDVSTPYNVN